MKMNAGIITPHLIETKEFYTSLLNFTVVYEADWFLLLQAPDSNHQISFLQPGHASQQPIFQTPFGGKGVYLTIEVDDADAYYQQLKDRAAALTKSAQGKKNPLKIEVELRDEPWGDRHFSFYDPNGIGIDIVKYSGS